MRHLNLEYWLRPNILNMKPYSSARDEYSGADMIFLDANENPFETALNRYPDPKQGLLKEKISDLLGVHPEQLFIGNGSDEAIDLLIRASCQPSQDRVLSISPSYGMYQVCAEIQGVAFDKVLLNNDFSFNTDRIKTAIHPSHKLLFLCSPNNPTGNTISRADLVQILETFGGVVVVDEAYIDFSETAGFLELLSSFENLVLLRTFSKAWGLAGIRCGIALSNSKIISILSKIKYPYNLNTLTQKMVVEALGKPESYKNQVELIIQERELLVNELSLIDGILEVYPSQANFVLIKVKDAHQLYGLLLKEEIVVRNRSSQDLCEGCLRLTIGTPNENQKVLKTLQKLLS